MKKWNIIYYFMYIVDILKMLQEVYAFTIYMYIDQI